MAWYVYLLKCADGSYYTGATTDPAKRLEQHQAGLGARYTRSRRPLELVYTEACPDKSSALKREWALKQLSHQAKQQLVRGTATQNRDC